jgi:hypothetical protein
MNGPILYGIRAALIATGSLDDVTDWYHAQGPGDAVAPYGIIQIAAGGDLNDNPCEEVDEDWIVKIVDTDAARAMTLGDAIRTALHKTTYALGAGWTLYDSEHSGPPFFYAENVEKGQRWHAGSTYRIRASKDR